MLLYLPETNSKRRRSTMQASTTSAWKRGRKNVLWSSSSLMTFQTACGSLSFSIDVRFAWAFTYFFTLADGLAGPGCQWHFTWCVIVAGSQMMVFSFAPRLHCWCAVADGLRLRQSLGQSLCKVIKIIIMQVSLRGNFSAFDDVRSHQWGKIRRSFSIRYWCDWRDEYGKNIPSCLGRRKSTAISNRYNKINYVCEASNLCAFNLKFVFPCWSNGMQTARRTRDKFTQSPKIKYTY